MTVSSAEGVMSVRLVFSITPPPHHYTRLSQQMADKEVFLKDATASRVLITGRGHSLSNDDGFVWFCLVQMDLQTNRYKLLHFGTLCYTWVLCYTFC